MMAVQSVSKYLLDNPEKIKTIFTKVFGRYLLRYYDIDKGYMVTFSETNPTSYHSPDKKVICIALKNVKEMLKFDVPILAIAYHELAHSLYTNDETKMKIIRGVWYNNVSRSQLKIKQVWNVLEDEYIERKLVKDYPFLDEVLSPLEQIIEDDGKLLTWRKGNMNIDPRLLQLAEEFAKKRLTQKRSIEIISEIITTYYPDEEYSQLPEKQPPSDDDDVMKDYEDMYDDDEASEDESDDTNESEEDSDNEENENEEDSDNEENDIEDEESDEDIEDEDIEEESDEDIEDEESDEDTEEEDDVEREELERKQNEWDELKSLKERLDQRREEIKELEGDETVKKMLLDETNEEEEQYKILRYNQAVIPTEIPIGSPYNTILDKVYDAKHFIQGSKTRAQTKGYSYNVSPKINVQKIVESQAHRKQPKVFYGKGQDVRFLKKVVVFEDVSYSTVGFTKLLSTIAKTLVDGFDGSEWWLYGKLLYQKHKLDYKYASFGIANQVAQVVERKSGQQNTLGGGTQTENLLVVMEKYKYEDNIYVIITDGDMSKMFQGEHKDLLEKFKHKTAIIGFLDDEIKENFPYTYDILDDLIKMEGLKQTQENEAKKVFQEIVVKSTKEIIKIIKERL